jgi:hypothetical protein
MKNSENFSTALPERLADVTDINITNARAQWQSSIDRRRTIVWVFGHIVGVSMDRIDY